MTETIMLDGKRYTEKKEDSKSLYEYSDQNEGETNITQPTELGETLREVNKDAPEADGRMTSIDMKARITPLEKSAYHAFGALISMGFFSRNALFIIRSGLRLSVSLGGEGRKESVDIVRGVKDAESKSGFMEKAFGGMMPKR